MRVGVIGLGTGTLAAYGREGDVFRFYEINPEVVRFAREQFTYLADSGAKIEIVPGDARLALEREAPQGYDVLAVDAFSSDAIPVHLITREALALLPAARQARRDRRVPRLQPFPRSRPGGGAPRARERGARDRRLRKGRGGRGPDAERLDPGVARRQRRSSTRRSWMRRKSRTSPEWRTWTDDYSNLVQVIK